MIFRLQAILKLQNIQKSFGYFVVWEWLVAEISPNNNVFEIFELFLSHDEKVMLISELIFVVMFLAKALNTIKYASNYVALDDLWLQSVYWVSQTLCQEADGIYTQDNASVYIY